MSHAASIRSLLEQFRLLRVRFSLSQGGAYLRMGGAALIRAVISAILMDALQVDDTTLDVTELPVRKWTQDYKEFLEGLIKPEEKAGPAVLADYREHHSDADVHFSLQV